MKVEPEMACKKEVRIFIKISRKPSVHECKGVVQSRGIGTPCAELLGALFAWHLYRDYQRLHGGETFGFDPLGRSELGHVGMGSEGALWILVSQPRQRKAN